MTEMERALEADGIKLQQLTGEDRGPWWEDDLDYHNYIWDPSEYWQDLEDLECDTTNASAAPTS